MSDSPLVISVILNTNRREDTLACLESLRRNTYPRQQVIVLDNASTDGSVEAIRSEFPHVHLIQLEDNQGYAGNNNVGIRAALDLQADWVLVLNEDTLLADDCLEQLVKHAHPDPEIGIAGPLVYHHSEPAVIQSAGGKLGANWESIHIAQNEPDVGQFSRPRRVDWISGCALMVRREVIEQVGMLEARFFYYWEETEWCLRARRAGWEVVHIPSARLWHKGVQRDYQPSPNVTYYSTRNRLFMLQKHRAPLRVWAAVWLQYGRTLLAWSVRPKWRSQLPHRDAMWQGIWDYFRQRGGMRTYPAENSPNGRS
jgi:GT2 family glycosyltransferase